MRMLLCYNVTTHTQRRQKLSTRQHPDVANFKGILKQNLEKKGGGGGGGGMRAYEARANTHLDEVERETVSTEKCQDGVKRFRRVVVQGHYPIRQHHQGPQEAARQYLQRENTILQADMAGEKPSTERFAKAL